MGREDPEPTLPEEGDAMRFSSSVHNHHRHHNPRSRPWTWTLYLSDIWIAGDTAATAAEADAAVDAVIDGLEESLRAARRQQTLPGVKL